MSADERRGLEIPPELGALLEEYPRARSIFEGLSYSHRREHVEYIMEARRPETRQRRARKTIKALLEG